MDYYSKNILHINNYHSTPTHYFRLPSLSLNDTIFKKIIRNSYSIKKFDGSPFFYSRLDGNGMKKLFKNSPKHFWEVMNSFSSQDLRVSILGWILLRVNSHWPNSIVSIMKGGRHYVSSEKENTFINNFMNIVEPHWKKKFFYYCLKHREINTFASILLNLKKTTDICTALNIFMNFNKELRTEQTLSTLFEAIIVSPTLQTQVEGFKKFDLIKFLVIHFKNSISTMDLTCFSQPLKLHFSEIGLMSLNDRREKNPRHLRIQKI